MNVNNYHKYLSVVLYPILVLVSIMVLKCSSADDDSISLLRFDAIHYHGIMLQGYLNESSAFFPMFPMIWRALTPDPVLISIFNGSLFVMSMIVLIRSYGNGLYTVLSFLAAPSLFFVFMPYTEAIFFTGSTIILLSLRKMNMATMLVGLSICTLSRPAFTAVLPSLLLAISLSSMVKRRKIIFIASSILVSAACLVCVAFIQQLETGSWLGFYTAQQGYGNTLKIPNLPLTSWGGGPIVRLDSVALLVGGICASILTFAFYRFDKGSWMKSRPELVMSAGYMAAVSAIALFLRGGELYSLNRFVFATPFLFILLNEIPKQAKLFQRSTYWWIALGLLVYTLFFGSYVHIQTFSTWVGLVIYLSLHLYLLTTKREHVIARAFILVFAFGIQLYLIDRYLHGVWVA